MIATDRLLDQAGDYALLMAMKHVLDSRLAGDTAAERAWEGVLGALMGQRLAEACKAQTLH